MFQATVLSGAGGKNVHVQVNGTLSKGETVLDWNRVVGMEEVSHDGHLRLDAVTFAISDKMEVWLGWDVAGGDPPVFLPLQGRGFLNFESMGGVKPAGVEGRTGDVLLYAFGPESPSPRHFLLMLDFSKQRG